VFLFRNQGTSEVLANDWNRHYTRTIVKDLSLTTPRIRFGRAGDAAAAARLIIMSDSAFLPFLFGDRLESALRRFLSRPGTLFSYEHTRIIEVNGQVAGMLLGYGYGQMRKEMLPTALRWLRVLGFGLLRRLPQLLRIAFTQPAQTGESANWLSPGEFYISNMAIKPEFRRHGLGRLLLKDALANAYVLGCRRVALDVDIGNRAAIGLYEGIGFAREEHNLMVMGKFEFLRMSRAL